MSTAPKHHWLVAGYVIYADPNNPDQENGQVSLNTMITTTEQALIRDDLGRAQAGLMQRFVLETTVGKTSQIKDVFLIAITHLGLMTEAQFQQGFDPKPEAKPRNQKGKPSDQLSLQLS